MVDKGQFIAQDRRCVLTLDAGGTSFRFAAVRGGSAVTDTIALPSGAHDLPTCLANLISGFAQVREQCPEPPVAISFAFPGPADYPNGIVGDLPNLPAFRGGVAIGPMLQDHFHIPVFVNNDGSLFAYGEAIAGFLPYVNELLSARGRKKQYRNLIGVTLGTGFGGGIVISGNLHAGDNSAAGQVWLMRNKLRPGMNAEEGACIRAVRRVYAEASDTPLNDSPDPKEIAEIGLEQRDGAAAAAREAFRELGEVVGNALAEAVTLVDGLVVIGGGLAGAWPLFLPTVVAEMNSTYRAPDGRDLGRLVSMAYNIEDESECDAFVRGETREIAVPGSGRRVAYDPAGRVAVGISRLGASRAVSLGAYAFALAHL